MSFQRVPFLGDVPLGVFLCGSERQGKNDLENSFWHTQKKKNKVTMEMKIKLQKIFVNHISGRTDNQTTKGTFKTMVR
jgi:hypothetical protein